MTVLLLVRHGETDWNREGRWQGHADPPLNDLGRAQARELAARIAGKSFDAIYSSDLQRAHETALIVAASKRMSVTPVVGLREIDVGSWSGLTKHEIAARFPRSVRHDGETYEHHLARVLAAVKQIVSAHPEGRALIVSHGGSLRSLRKHATGTAPPMGNCELYALAYCNGLASEVEG